MPTEEIVVVGRIGAPYGVKGWLNLQSFTTPAENLLQYRPWRVARKANGPWRELDVQQCRPHKKSFVALFAGLTDRDAAAGLTGSFIGVVGDDLPDLRDPDEFYWRDLVGCEVFNEGGDLLGQVDSLMETGARDVLVITAPEKHTEDLLIPFAEQYIEHVDLDARRIVVKWDASW